VVFPRPRDGCRNSCASLGIGRGYGRQEVQRRALSGAPSRARSRVLEDRLREGRGRVEFVELSHQYLQLTSLVGVS
jgi:hypothetical protein